MQLYWTVDAYASCGRGAYRITINDDKYEVRYLPNHRAYWERVSFEDTLAQAKMTASVHADAV
jgi:hypothetical protein